MSRRERRTVHGVREYGLGMKGIEQIETVENMLTSDLVHTVKDDVFGALLETHVFEYVTQWYPRPFADCAPALVAAVHRNLGPRWHGTNIIERGAHRSIDEATNREIPIAKPRSDHSIIGRVRRDIESAKPTCRGMVRR